MIDTKAPCPQRVFCFAAGKDLIEIHTTPTTHGNYNNQKQNNKNVIKVMEGDGERICELIMNQVETAQVIDRD